ncbi:prolyl 3-hydroxylase 2-like [Acanthaster planci]|uniref:Prolyl 3-hydroxylase 2-like n=1 Tax=Acanthaster planci TaxID=133434 RepID=A0A8B7YYQ5_ACAPL|nr:prolyl 3-hydroxylase 2-like [Acanthaster planci]
MQLAVVMAQLLTLISLVSLLFVAKTFIQTAESETEENTTPTTTYDEWYQSGMDSYNKEDWEDTIYYLEKALEEFNFYRSSLVECRLKCSNVTRTRASSSQKDEENLLTEMQYFQGLFLKANCVRKCKFDKLGNRPQLIDNDLTDKFLSRMPYSYLQFAYYKSFEYEKAVAAAYTYVQWHQDDEVMQNNLEYYRNLHGITEEHLVDLEERPHHKYFMEGYKAYERGDFAAVIENIHKALEHYWKVDEECRALCEGKYENREFMDLYEAISNHFASVLYCKSQCEEWNSRMKGTVIDNYLPNHYHYLQYAYHKEGRMTEAVNAAASFLALVPNDPTMTSNMHYYEDEEGVSKYTVQPADEAVAYQRRKDLEQKMLQFAKLHFWGDEDQEYLEEHYRSTAQAMLYQDQAEPINPDEVLLGAEILEALQTGQSFAENHADDPEEVMTPPEEIWADYTDEEEEEVDVEHFPEYYFEKPEEIWPEDEFVLMDEDDFGDEPVKEYSPEPGVLYGEDDEEDEERTRDHFLDANEMAASDEDKERTSNSEKFGPRSKMKKDDFVDPNLGYHVDDSGIKWPSIKDDSKAEKRPEVPTQRTDGSRNEADDVMEGISALEGLKKSLSKQDLFPSGPPRAGPSIQGRRYIEDFDNEQVIEEPSYVPSLDGVKLYMNAAMLNGTKRMAADKLATQIECDNLIKLMDIESKMGDGYSGKVYPHTKYESFEGMTVLVAVKAAKVGREMNLRLFPICSLVTRFFTPSRTDLSHPIHADNCSLDDAHVCHKTPPAYTWRDWSAILYLNEDFEGGEFVFAHPNMTYQAHLKPKCGRLVVFSAGEENVHGAKAVLSSRRCALALWFTEDPRYQEQEFNKAAVLFRETWEEQEAMKKS